MVVGLSLPRMFDLPPTYEHMTIGPGRVGGGSAGEYAKLVTLYAKKAERNAMMVLDLLKDSMGINAPESVGVRRMESIPPAGGRESLE